MSSVSRARGATRLQFLPLVLVPLLVGVVIWLWLAAGSQPAGRGPVVQPTLNGAVMEPAVDLPPLAFDRTDGGTFTTADTRGRISLFYFGYTHCVDICPVSLAQLSGVRRDLGKDAARVDFYFVTVDPARDTPTWMRGYVANFPGIVGLTGSDTQLAQAQAAFNVEAERRDMGGDDYLMDHSAAVYLVNASSQVALAYSYGTASEDILADLHRLVGELDRA